MESFILKFYQPNSNIPTISTILKCQRKTLDLRSGNKILQRKAKNCSNSDPKMAKIPLREISWVQPEVPQFKRNNGRVPNKKRTFSPSKNPQPELAG